MIIMIDENQMFFLILNLPKQKGKRERERSGPPGYSALPL